MPDCIFAPYFPPEEPLKFTHVHKIFGASNISKLLHEVLPHQREDTVNSLAYEAEARVRDPVYGCVGTISFLQMQVELLQKELDAANAELLHYACGCNHFQYHHNTCTAALPTTTVVPNYPMSNYTEVARTTGAEISYNQAPSTSLSFPWNDKNVSGQGGAAGQGP